ncbi:unnamed protein product, partial [Ilex paraguariensis]
MARTKQTAPGSPVPVGTGSRKRVEEAGLSGGEQRKKKKNDPHTKSIKTKNVTCMQQVDQPTLEPLNDVVR